MDFDVEEVHSDDSANDLVDGWHAVEHLPSEPLGVDLGATISASCDIETSQTFGPSDTHESPSLSDHPFQHCQKTQCCSQQTHYV